MAHVEREERVARVFAEIADLPREQRERAMKDHFSSEEDLYAQLQALFAAHDTLTAPNERGFILDHLDLPRALALLRGDGEDAASDAMVGPYRVLRELGHGGMGFVYLAEREAGQRASRVAVKVVRPWIVSDPMAVARFEAERQIVAALDHPGIARQLDSGVMDDGRPWFAMELVEGLPIDEYADSRSLTSIARLSLLATVCDVVHHAHRRHIVHRDLKPANILVTEAGEVKLLDFGIAKLLPEASGFTVLPPTRQRARPMTLEYASPEQLQGGTLSPATDVYSLGVLLYRLLAGRHPHRVAGEPLADLPRRIAKVIPEPPSAAEGLDRLDARLRGEVDRIVLTALRKKPEDRYATAGEMASDLRVALH